MNDPHKGGKLDVGACWDTLAGHSQTEWRTITPEEQMYERLNALAELLAPLINDLVATMKRVDALEESANPSPHKTADMIAVEKYLDKHPEARKPGGVIPCKSLDPLVIDDEEKPDE